MTNPVPDVYHVEIPLYTFNLIPPECGLAIQDPTPQERREIFVFAAMLTRVVVLETPDAMTQYVHFVFVDHNLFSIKVGCVIESPGGEGFCSVLIVPQSVRSFNQILR